MRNFKTLISLFLLAIFSLSLLGCGGPKLKEENIVGQWMGIRKTTVGGGRDIGFVVEFFPDKTVSLPIGKGTWAITADGQLKIEVFKTTMFGTLAGDELTVNYPDNRGAVILKRK